ncbi:hypothetical protein BpHYR1_037817 [Brachionus plicatilis]|uniref:Uncharacterized protein n=1 Tax=Brachionus plicatilis TaxID=10195 RepID=A0A3M7QLA3_BRAPC|nr:hypothetical protein BpHYR1_037817 [Brachionus plicatilis]
MPIEVTIQATCVFRTIYQSLLFNYQLFCSSIFSAFNSNRLASDDLLVEFFRFYLFSQTDVAQSISTSFEKFGSNQAIE